ncbi:MAG TPA: glycerophosphodiester phosphodiesterase [Geobacteraceae bacterium]
MLVLCHRGYHLHAPENTIDAFAAAIEAGADGIETDVRLSADGVAVLFHDRFAADGREVSALSHAALSEAAGYPVPSLESALRLSCRGADPILWDLEIKTPQALHPALRTINRLKDARRILITSFRHTLIEEASRLIDVELGILVAHRPPDTHLFPGWLAGHPKVNTIVWDYETIDEVLVALTRAAGLRCFVYGAVTAAEHGELMAWNVDAVITDYPELVKKS